MLRLYGLVERQTRAALTGFVVEKKSMSFPIVNGTLIDTALDTMSRPIAMPSGFFSGIASATILRKDDAVLAESCVSAGRKRFHMDFFGAGGLGGLLGVSGVGAGADEEPEESGGGERTGLENEKCLRPSRSAIRTFGDGRRAGHGGLETCRASRVVVRAGGRRVGATRTRAQRASIVVGVVYRPGGRTWWEDEKELEKRQLNPRVMPAEAHVPRHHSRVRRVRKLPLRVVRQVSSLKLVSDE